MLKLVKIGYWLYTPPFINCISFIKIDHIGPGNQVFEVVRHI